MTNCKHQWLAVTGQPIYKCVHCGTFMRIECRHTLKTLMEKTDDL